MDSKLYKGSIEPILLKLLSEKGEMYGYQITQLIKTETKGEIEIKEGSLYPLLHKLEANQIIESNIKMINNRGRKYYQLTEKGQKESQLLFEEFATYLQTMRNIFNPKTSLG